MSGVTRVMTEESSTEARNLLTGRIAGCQSNTRNKSDLRLHFENKARAVLMIDRNHAGHCKWGKEPFLFVHESFVSSEGTDLCSTPCCGSRKRPPPLPQKSGNRKVCGGEHDAPTCLARPSSALGGWPSGSINQGGPRVPCHTQSPPQRGPHTSSCRLTKPASGAAAATLAALGGNTRVQNAFQK